MHNKMPLISIITVVYNNRALLSEAMQSVFAQDYPNIEYIVVDGGSTDGTMDVIKSHADHIAKWVSEPDKGIYDAMNKGIAMAAGEIVGILNSDDIYASPHAVSAIVEAMEKARAAAGWGDIVYADAASRIVRRWRSSPYSRGKFLRGWHPPHPAFFVRREVYEKYNSFDTKLRIAADYEFMLRVLEKHRVSSIYVPMTIVTMRTGGASHRSIRDILRLDPRALRAEHEVFEEDRRVWRMNGLRGGTLAALMKPLRKVPQLFVAHEVKLGNRERNDLT